MRAGREQDALGLEQSRAAKRSIGHGGGELAGSRSDPPRGRTHETLAGATLEEVVEHGEVGVDDRRERREDRSRARSAISARISAGAEAQIVV